MTVNISELKVGDKVRDEDGEAFVVIAVAEDEGRPWCALRSNRGNALRARYQRDFDNYNTEKVLDPTFVYVNVYKRPDGTLFLGAGKASIDEVDRLARKRDRVSRMKLELVEGRYDD